MSMVVPCTCGKRLRTPAEYVGRRVKCPGCGRSFVLTADLVGESYLLAPESAPEPPPRKQPPPPVEKAADGRSGDAYGVVAEPLSRPPLLYPQERPEYEEDSADDRAEAKRRARRARRGEETEADVDERFAAQTDLVTSIRERMYLVLILALIPLALAMTWKSNDVEERLERTLQANPQALERLHHDKEPPSLDALLGALPGKRIQGAHLPRGSWGHWLYATASGVLFFGIVLTMFGPQSAKVHQVLLVAVSIATAGIFFLLLVQLIALWTYGMVLVGANPVVLIFWILKFIGFSYRAAVDPENGFILSMLGFTLGVGLCEELVKALPLIWHFNWKATLGWRGACLWGLAAGVGFGVSEGITYSSDFYNGLETGGIYVVRFISCVALHAIWSASAGITIWKCQTLIQEDRAWFEWPIPIARVLGIVILLHGLYDTLLKKDMNGLALLVAVGSFVWLAWQIEHARWQEAREREA